MILDTSAVVSVVRDEPLADQVLDQALQASRCRISAANLLEAHMVVDRSGTADAELKVDRFVRRVSARIEPVTHAQILIARRAFHRYGKGSGHPARLNFGDCFAYALARFYDEPLLFIGRDFAATDIQSALPS